MQSSIWFLFGLTLAAGMPLETRQSDRLWHNEHGDGKIEVYFSDTKVNWGDKNPSDYFAKLDCDSVNCDDLSGKATVLNDDDVTRVNAVSISFDTNYDKDVVNAFKKILRTALEKTTEKKNKKYTESTCGGMGFCDSVGKTIDQYYAPEAINVRHVDSDSNMKFTVKIDAPSGPGMCSTILGIANGVASGINGVASGAFQIASMFCDDK